MLDSPRGSTAPATPPPTTSPAGSTDTSDVMHRPAPAGVDNLLWKLSGPQERCALLKDAPPVPDFKSAGGGSLDKSWGQKGTSHGASKSIAANGDFKDVKTQSYNDGSTTGKRTTGTVTDIHGKTTPVKDDERGRNKPEVKGSVAAKVKVGPDWEGSFGANYKTGGINASGAWSAEAFAGAKAKAGGSATVGPDGAKVQASASASVGVDASIGGSYTKGPATVDGKASVQASASAEGEVHAGIGKKGVDLGVGGKAEVSASADAEAGVEVAGVKGTVEGGVGVGIGVHGDAGVEFNAHEVGVHYDVGAFVGLGGHISGGFEVDPSKLASNVGSWLGFG